MLLEQRARVRVTGNEVKMVTGLSRVLEDIVKTLAFTLREERSHYMVVRREFL